MGLYAIHEALKALVKTMTVAGGYNLDWTKATVNPTNADWNSVASTAYPIVDIYVSGLDDEQGDRDVLSSSYLSEWKISIIPNSGSVTLQNLDKAIDDIIRLTKNNPSISSTCFLWWFSSGKLGFDQMHSPYYGVEITIKIRYKRIN